jgi:hypothetical protein
MKAIELCKLLAPMRGHSKDGWRVMGRCFACLLLTMLLAVPVARAHEIRPAYLDIREIAPGQYSVLWRTPVLSGMRLPVILKLPGARSGSLACRSCPIQW